MTTDEDPQKKSAFVVSPIGQPGSEPERNANLALKYIFKKALDPAEWLVHRADDGEKPDSIGHHVIRSIVEADLVIADLTDHNPNVFYELAVAHGYRKPVVHLITEGRRYLLILRISARFLMTSRIQRLWTPLSTDWAEPLLPP